MGGIPYVRIFIDGFGEIDEPDDPRGFVAMQSVCHALRNAIHVPASGEAACRGKRFTWASADGQLFDVQPGRR